MKNLPNLHNHNLGALGEQAASQFLASKGFTILETNFKIRDAEIDIIALRGETLVFIEVKTRITDEHGLPEEAIDRHKLGRVIKAAEYYQYLHPDVGQEIRIDAVCILLKADKTVEYINHYENVTG